MGKAARPAGDDLGSRKRELGRPTRIVVKIGSAVLAKGGLLDPAAVARLAADVSGVLDLDKDRRVVIVSSGAVASGYRALGLARPPKTIVHKQAAAAVGQLRLMSSWAEAFAKQSNPRAVAQVLLTAEDIDHRQRFLNARRTLETLLDAGGAGTGTVIPIINENDSVSYAEIKLGDNDHLSSLVASLVGADLLVILSSVGGVWGGGAKKEIVPEIRSLKDGLALVRSDKTDVGTGGMETKIKAACTAAALGTGVIIAGGDEPDVLTRLLAGEPLGTYFPPPHSSSAMARATAARKRWIGFAARPKGKVTIDAGARKAVVERGASLLPSGIVKVDGTFDAGALVELLDPQGRPIARGLSLYGAEELRAIRGKKSSEIEQTLGSGAVYAEEAVHRDDLVLIEQLSGPN